MKKNLYILILTIFILCFFSINAYSQTFMYAPNQDLNNVSVINTTTNNVVATIPVGIAPIELVVSFDGKRVYVSNAVSNTISVINTTTNTVIATIPTTNRPAKLCISADNSRVYAITNSITSTISVINTTTNTIITTIPMLSINPSAIIISPNGQRLYVADSGDNNFSIINTITNTIITTIPIAGLQPTSMMMSADGSRFYIGHGINGGGNTCRISVFSTATNALITTIPVFGDFNVRNMTISPDGTKIYFTVLNNVGILNTSTNAVTINTSLNIPPNSGTGDICVSPDNSKYYVSHTIMISNPSVALGSIISIANANTNALISTLPMITGAVSSLGKRMAVVTCLTITSPTILPNGTIDVLYNQILTQTSTGTVTWSVSAGALPNGLSLNPSTGAITGTPTTNGIFNFTMQVISGGCTQTKAFSITIACPALRFINAVANFVVVNVPYTFDASVTNNNAPIIYSVNPALPAGLSLNATTGIISGTATTITNSFICGVTAFQSSGNCTITQSYDFEVYKCFPFGILPSDNFLPDGYVNQPYVGVQLTIASPVAGETYTFEKLNTISWQEGLTLSASGFISGTPTFSTSIAVLIQATAKNADCKSLKTTYTLVVYPDPTTSIDNSFSSQIKVFPNPSNGDFKVDFGSLQLTKGTLRVYDAQGKKIISSEIEKNTQQTAISLENKANGIYLLEISSDKGRILKKLVKE